MPSTPVLIVGAGPTGLNLALSLARRKVPFRLISQAAGPSEHSRAMVVQARTLEFYGQFGFAEEMIGQGIRIDRAHLREAGGAHGEPHEVTSFTFDDLGGGISPYPFALTYPQDDHERFLVSKLEAAGGRVEWGSKLIGFVQERERIRANIQSAGGNEQVDADYICGCDGAHSVVRETLKIGFPGATYEQLFYVADVRIDRGFERDLLITLGKQALALLFPVRSNGMQRVIGLVPPEVGDRQGLTFEDVRSHVELLLGVRVSEVNWFSTYRVHHRVAEHFRVKRAFILGDAAHIHSPAGGQGMNTGIGDAINLGWKLAHVVQQRADVSLLDSFEPERIGFARSLVETTDRAFTGLVAEGAMGEFTRRILAPLVFGVATRFDVGRHAIFRVLSQTRIHYPESPLSAGKAGGIDGGDRLPWAGHFDPLRSLDWQIHVYGELDNDLNDACRKLRLPVHTFAWSKQADEAGFKRDAAYLIRPDGYVALVSAEQKVDELRGFVEKHKLRFVG